MPFDQIGAPPAGGVGELPIADAPELLTAEWVTAALRAGGALEPDRSVTAVEQQPVGTGQMCDSVRLRLTFDGATAAPSSIVAKLPAADETSRATALSLRSYENEVRFYQQLAPHLPMRTPAVFHADIDVETASFVLLLEDLAPAEQGDQLAGCSPEVAEVAVDELVRLHAPRWGDASLAELEWLHRDRATSQQFMLMLLPTLWEGFLDRYRDDLGPEVHEAGGQLFGRLEAYLFADTEPWSIVHGDYRLDNLLFDPSPGGTPIAVVDWQTVTHGPPLQDVAYFIGAGLEAETRRQHEEALVRGYHDGLVAAGVAGYDWERCWHDYRRGTWLGLIMAVAASMLVERTDRGDQMFLTMAGRHSRHALDLDAQAVIGT
ncbi:ecdysteroid 22-kinase family protein [Aquihabitans sp. G128]|uniref:phosphotransferase n=1 Tax=Aquihabitans sp. G128 TaxID=2849779 RepID=UPI001C23381D|nr:phosphotransferase [Aquihabitans sp. G128]QXC62478.1 ecdysteroid 22-kinase family protein [Aquihabitans sp. G128]